MDNKDTGRLIGISVISSLVTALIVSMGVLWSWKNPDTTQGQTVGTSKTLTSESQDAVVNAVKKAKPAVVAIKISVKASTLDLQNLDPFGNPLEQDQLPLPNVQWQDIGGGSGFLVRPDGYIVTNQHVVLDPKAEYTVYTNDGQKHAAQIIASDTNLDIAVIKIQGSDFPHLEFDNSDNLEVGQTVIAIGNALAEFRNTVSVGVVSGLSRSITTSDGLGEVQALDQLIQTDAAINPGNSGGPLLDLEGNVVGVNVAVAGNAENIGFALSSNGVRSIVESVVKTGKIVRPYIGVRYTPINPDLAEKNGLRVDYGVLVRRGTGANQPAVIPGSPAEKAGLQPNDIILEIDGSKLTQDKSLSSIILNKQVGDTIKLKILRGEQEQEVELKLEEMQ